MKTNIIQLEDIRGQRGIDFSDVGTSFQKITKECFLMGPFSMKWISKAANLPGKSFQLALSLAHQSRMSQKDIVKPSQTLLSQFGISRYSCYRAITALEKSKLIIVLERRRGCSPTLKLIGLKPEGARW